MRRLRYAMAAVATAAAMAGPAWAAEPETLASVAVEAGEERLRALVGNPVYSADGVRFGGIQSLVIDQRNQRVLGAVVRYGGFLGAFANEVLVPADQIATVNADSVVLLWTAAEMEAAPPVDGAQVAVRDGLMKLD